MKRCLPLTTSLSAPVDALEGERRQLQTGDPAFQLGLQLDTSSWARSSFIGSFKKSAVSSGKNWRSSARNSSTSRARR